MDNQLNQQQKDLLDLFFGTKTSAKVLHRETSPDGTYKFYDAIRDTRPVDFPIDETEFAIKIHEVNPEAPLSPFYINLRNLPEDLIEKIGDVFAQIPLDERPDYCTGIPKTALAMAQKFSEKSGIPFIDIFDKVGSDTERRIEVKPDAPKGEGKKILIIDDVVSQARSKFEAIESAKNAGYKISGILVLVDREQGGAKQVEEMGVKVYSGFKISDIMKYYLSQRKVTQEQYDNIINYIRQ